MVMEQLVLKTEELLTTGCAKIHGRISGETRDTSRWFEAKTCAD
jgi:hypothetical protein